LKVRFQYWKVRRQAMEIPEIKNKLIQNKIKVGNTSPAKGESSASSTGSTQSSDKTALSSEAVSLEKAINAVKAQPETIQAEKVARIKAEIADGTYKVDPYEIAGSVLKDIITQS
jgi:negative regulator of flagellin synthesis FlgM